MSAFEAKRVYLPAKSSGGRGGNTSQPFISDDLSTDYKPSLEEFALLTEPINFFLSQCTCYDMMGMSTQVVVVDVQATLAVAFIAAQETRVQSCVLWDQRRREFVGVLSSTDYIKILLYCEAHPEEAEAVSSWTIQYWREVKDTVVTPMLLGAGDASSLAGARKVRPSSTVTCTADTSLRDCLAKMRAFNVRRIVTLAEKEAASFSVVAMMDVAQIVEYLGVMFFHIEKSGGSLWDHPTARGSEKGSPATANAPANVGGGTRGGGGGGGATLGSAKGPLAAPSSAASSLSEPSSAHRPSSGAASPNTANHTGGDAGGFFSMGDAALPPHVTSILAASELTDAAAAAEPRVGPYRSIFDIPFSYLPAGVGVHRSTPLFTTMDSALNEALKLMLRNDVDSIAVCTSDMIIVDVISRSDLLRMENQGVYDTTLTVREALASKASASVFVVYEQDTVRDIFAHFVSRRVKELFIVDPDTGKLKGQLNVSEFVFFLVFTAVHRGGGGGEEEQGRGKVSGAAASSSTGPGQGGTTAKPSSASTTTSRK